jgi:hypothetical protein
MAILRFLHQLLAFSLEMAMLAALGYWGFREGNKSPLKYLLGFGLPIAAITLWALWAAPKSTTRLEQPFLLMFKLVLFGITTFGLYRSGQPHLAYWFAGLALVSVLVEYSGVL